MAGWRGVPAEPRCVFMAGHAYISMADHAYILMVGRAPSCCLHCRLVPRVPWPVLTGAQPLAEALSQRSPRSLVYYCYLFACTRANPACTHPCAFSLPFALACMAGKMSYKQIKIETQKRTNYNMFNYLFENHSSSLLYSVAGNVLLAIWQGHFFLPCFIPSLGGGLVSEPERREKLCSMVVLVAWTGEPEDKHFFGLHSTACVRSSFSINCKCFFTLRANITVANTDSLPTALLPWRQAEGAALCWLLCCSVANCHPCQLAASLTQGFANQLNSPLLALCCSPAR